MRRLLAALVLIASAGVASAQSPAFPADSAMAKIAKRGKLIAAVKNDLPLFGYLDPKTNEYTGFEVDIAREIARAILGDPNKIEFKSATTRTRIPMVKEEVVDVALATITMTPERAKEVDFSDVYFVTGPAVGVMKDSPLPGKKLEDFAGKTIAVTKGSVYEKIVKERVPTIKVVQIETHAEILQALQTKRIDGVVTDETNLQSMGKHDPNLVVAVPPFEPYSKYGAAMKQGRPEFVKFVNGVVQGLKASGKWKEIYTRNIGTTAPAPPPAN
jgi:aspartate/glutamate/glutamine transport system substrate-binding protein